MAHVLEIPSVQDTVLEFVGPKYFRNLRLVNHAWNKKTVAVLAGSKNWTVRMSPENIDEYCLSELLRSNPLAASDSRMKIALDFGERPTTEEFHHIIDTVLDTVLDKDGLASVKELKFQGTDGSFQPNAQDWYKLLTFVKMLPNLHTLELFSPNWIVPDGTFLHQQHYYGTLAFPSLVELSYCWQEPTLFLIDALLQPGVVPQLSKLQITAVPEDIGRSLYSLALGNLMQKLDHDNFPQLSELSLTLDSATSAILSVDPPVQLHHLHRLHLHILRCSDGITGPWGDFISHIFPELRSLDLDYDEELGSAPGEAENGGSGGLKTWFPNPIGQLPFLNSLTYRKKDAHGSENAVTNQLQRLSVIGTQLLSDKLPILQNVSAQLDFELFNRAQVENNPLLQFLGVTRLELQIPAWVWSTIVEVDSDPSLGILDQVATNLHTLYPNITCLALDLNNISNPSAKIIGHLIAKVVADGRALEEFQLLNCNLDLEVGNLLLELLQDQIVSSSLQPVRRLKLTSAAVTASNGNGQSNATPKSSTRSSLSLTKIAAAFPKLVWIGVDESLGRSEVAKLYTETGELQTTIENIKIEFN